MLVLKSFQLKQGKNVGCYTITLKKKRSLSYRCNNLTNFIYLLTTIRYYFFVSFYVHLK